EHTGPLDRDHWTLPTPSKIVIPHEFTRRSTGNENKRAEPLDAGDKGQTMSIKGRFDRFMTKIRPTDEHIEEADRQTAFMIKRLHDKVADDGSFTLEKILRAGSNANFTSLRKTDENLFDV